LTNKLIKILNHPILLLGAAMTLYLPGTDADEASSAINAGVDAQGQTTWVFPPAATDTAMPGTSKLYYGPP
jgi:hypothetical protein